MLLCRKRTFFKTLISKKAIAWRVKKLRVMITFYEKQCLPIIR